MIFLCINSRSHDYNQDSSVVDFQFKTLLLTKNQFKSFIHQYLFKGIVLRTSEADPICRLEFAPMTAIPSPFPRKEYEKVKSVQKALNELLHRAAHDREFLTSSLKK